MFKCTKMELKNYLGLLLLPLFSCSEKMEVERVEAKYELLSEDIFTRMPGNLLLADSYLVWTDPFTTDYFVHVHQVSDGKKVGVMGKQGQGPNEFITPMVSQLSYNRNIHTVDANGKTRGYLSIDSLLAGKNPMIPFKDERESQLYKVDSVTLVGYTEDEEPFYLQADVDGSGLKLFGDYPIGEVKQHIGGTLAYNREREVLAFVSYDMPYLALYQKSGKGFTKECSTEVDDNYYDIVNGRIKFDRKRAGIREVCMSKDYIIGLQRDYAVDDLDERTVGRDVSKCPQTVFLYDYEGKLRKIVNLGIPVMRIAADHRSNVLYAIGADPEYILVKFEL